MRSWPVSSRWSCWPPPLVAIWIGRDRTQLQPYEIVSATAVSGLNSQSTVRYQGVQVGSAALNPDKPGQVRIRIGVAPSTPITESTWAELGVQGVTGLANVELRDDGSSLRRLTSTAAEPAAIPLRPGFRTARAARRQADLERRGSDQPTQAGAERAERAGAGTCALKNASRELQPAMAKIGPLVDSLGDASRRPRRAKWAIWRSRRASPWPA